MEIKMSVEFKENARHTFKQLTVSNQDVRAEFKVTHVGLSSFFTKDAETSLSETECFSLAKSFSELSPRLSAHSDQQYILDIARAKIQQRKRELGIKLDTERSSYSV